jgi:hypothetical protein
MSLSKNNAFLEVTDKEVSSLEVSSLANRIHSVEQYIEDINFVIKCNGPNVHLKAKLKELNKTLLNFRELADQLAESIGELPAGNSCS